MLLICIFLHLSLLINRDQDRNLQTPSLSLETETFFHTSLLETSLSPLLRGVVVVVVVM